MSEQTYIFSLEELGYALAVHQGEEMAAGLMKAFYGDLPEESWQLLFQAATHSLIAKGFIESIREADGEVTFIPAIAEIIRHLLSSSYMLRGVTERDSAKVLSIHVQQQRYLYHLSDGNTVHFFTWTEPEDWEEELVRFYGVEKSGAAPAASTGAKAVITEGLWNQLTEPGHVSVAVPTLCTDLSPDEQNLIAKWQQAFQANVGSMDNLSTIRIAHGDQTMIENILFLLPSDEGVWVIRNQEKDRNTEPQICIELQSASVCRETLGAFAASLLG
ncbi:hypothetical protein ACE3NQ_08470 [Paenibacillus terreus]|uniref:Uncharacterized protein n=1 Tax=Paenibacillus terreus TaxID=1387834 RepID=A0ABV5B5H6_9BACL